MLKVGLKSMYRVKRTYITNGIIILINSGVYKRTVNKMLMSKCLIPYFSYVFKNDDFHCLALVGSVTSESFAFNAPLQSYIPGVTV